MTPSNMILLALGALVAGLIGAAVSAWMLRRAPGQVAQTIEHDLAKVATDAIAKLVDKSGEAQEIVAAQKRMALKDQLVADIRAGLPAQVAPIPGPATPQ